MDDTVLFIMLLERQSSHTRKKQTLRRITQNQMLRQCASNEVENTMYDREVTVMQFFTLYIERRGEEEDDSKEESV